MPARVLFPSPGAMHRSRSCGTLDNCGYNRSDKNTPAGRSDRIRIHGLPAQAYGISVCPGTLVGDWTAFYRRTYGGTQSRSVARRPLLRPRRFPGRSIMAHDSVDLLLDVRHGALSKMHIDECGGKGPGKKEDAPTASFDGSVVGRDSQELK